MHDVFVTIQLGKVPRNSERLCAMGFLNQQVLKIQLRCPGWAPGISFDVKKEALRMWGGGCSLFSPRLSVAAAQTEKAQGPFHGVVVFATENTSPST